jgi:resuscitation-promoting factor RpfA
VVNRRSALLTALVCGDGGAIGLLRPRLGLLAAHLQHPHAWVTAAGADRALAQLSSAALWFAAVWLAVGLLAGVAASLPGAAGRCVERVGRALLPRAVRGLIAGSAGLGVLLAPVAVGASTPTGPAGPTGTATSSGQPASVPAPAWPISPAGTPPSEPSVSPAPTTASVPAPIWPSSTGPTPAAPAIGSTPKQAPAPAPHATRPATASPAHGVDVRAGDCLWLIASRRLGPAASAADVAAEWPRWYAANKAVIGADPAVIRPGEVLQPPAAGT